METDPATFGLFIKLFDMGLAFTKKILDRSWKPNESDKKAAWAMYVEMITRIITQPLPPKHGDEQTALKSIHSLFQTTRDILKEHGQGCVEFPKIAIVILNQKVRPFTAKWHRKDLEGAFESDAECAEFREELASLQGILSEYTRALAKIAEVEDLTKLLDASEE